MTAPTVVARRVRVAELHAQGVGLRAIAADLGCGPTTIARDVRALGLKPHAPGRPARLPKPEERVCDLDGCEVLFTPKPFQASRGGGRFCCVDHANKGKTYERKAIVWRECAQCKEEFWRWRTVAEKQGAMGGLARFCTLKCAGKYRWHKDGGRTVLPLFAYQAGSWGIEAREVWGGRFSRALAAAKGKKSGRPTELEPYQLETIYELADRNKPGRAPIWSQEKIAAQVGVSRMQVQRALATRERERRLFGTPLPLARRSPC